MENIDLGKLPTIFKFSALWNILPYYGYLHEWKAMLELTSIKTNQIWNNHKEAFTYAGRKCRLVIQLKHSKDIYDLFPKNQELFVIRVSTSSWFNYRSNETKGQTRYKVLILPLVQKLDRCKSVIIDKCSYSENIFITFLTKKEEAETVPLSLCTSLCTSLISNLRQFNLDEEFNIRTYIDKKLKTKRVVLTKIQEDEIRLNTVIAKLNSYPRSINFENYEEIEKKIAWPIDDCIWKPSQLLLDPSMQQNINGIHYGCINTIMTEKILKISLLNSIKHLELSKSLGCFDSIDNLVKISDVYPQIKIRFNFNHNWNKYSDFNAKIEFKERYITVVSNGKEWHFESANESYTTLFWWFESWKSAKKREFVLLKVSSFTWRGITIRKKLFDERKNSLVEDLKRQSLIDMEIYIIADTAISTFKVNLEYANADALLFKKFRFINIEINYDTDYYHIVEEINKLPKEHNYELSFSDSLEFLQSEEFKLIEFNFNSMIIIAFSFKIIFINSRSVDGNTKSKPKFIVFNEWEQETSIVGIDQLGQIISKIKFIR